MLKQDETMSQEKFIRYLKNCMEILSMNCSTDDCYYYIKTQFLSDHIDLKATVDLVSLFGRIEAYLEDYKNDDE